MNIRIASVADADLLAEYNHQLIRDEGHGNPMNADQLCDRMKGWLVSEYSAALISSDGIDAGYVLWREEPDYLYVRQFFIASDYRRRGIGRKAISELKETLWAGRKIRVEVLTGNVGGLSFWRAIGFSDYCITLEC